ncbi:MAG: tRNA preQ1(34) S-adenosylmethionine ribosyltransferase-isomerase QueA [Clostridia bacterium]|nr:tRNA preQ1(34) S-adenosylmethionine ribosyltransferase-isomerase QueA [Clostridia bacterium]
MKKSDFYYELPPELIAQTAAEPRDSSRLLVVDRGSGNLAHRIFRDITEYLRPGDTLVINDSKVIPARLTGRSARGAGSEVEILLLRQRGDDLWETIVRPGKKAREGDRVLFGDGVAEALIESVLDGGNRLVRLEYDRSRFGNVYTLLDEIGSMPLPPYITEKPSDPGRYQTVYAKTEGSAAAPTAGLHFTPGLLDEIKNMGVAVVPVMLHVGLGTFRPVKEDKISEHLMHTEFFSVSGEAARTINERRASGGRTVCVGTTSCRTLESAADEKGIIRPMSGDTGIFIYPGYRFRATDCLITNFHLPESTLLMLVSAFYDREKMLEVYRTAVEERYRFFSFGDAMIII